MVTIDRGEDHPLNSGTELPEVAPRPEEAMAGMAAMAGRVNAERVKLGARLVLEHGPGVVEALRPYSSPRPACLPDPLPVGGLAGSYLQVEFRPVAGMVAGAWRLLRDGEVVGYGVLGEGM